MPFLSLSSRNNKIQTTAGVDRSSVEKFVFALQSIRGKARPWPTRAILSSDDDDVDKNRTQPRRRRPPIPDATIWKLRITGRFGCIVLRRVYAVLFGCHRGQRRCWIAAHRLGTKACRYNWHSAGSLGLPFPALKYRCILRIKYTKAILSDGTQKLLWFEITKM